MDYLLVALSVALLVTLLTALTENLLLLGASGVAFGVEALVVLGHQATMPQDIVISMAMTFVGLALTRILMRSNGPQTVATRLPRRLPPL